MTQPLVIYDQLLANGIWAQFAALPSDTARAVLRVTLLSGTASPPPLIAVWDEDTSVPQPNTLLARVLGRVSFGSDALSGELELPLVLAVQPLAFTVRIALAADASHVSDVPVSAVRIETVADTSMRGALAARCSSATTCDACLARGEECGFCGSGAGACQLGWRGGPISSQCAAWAYAACPGALSLLAANGTCTMLTGARLRFDLSAVSRAVGSASLSLSSLVSPSIASDDATAFLTVSYRRSTRGDDLNGALCDELGGESRTLCTIAYGQRVRCDVADGVRHLLRNGERDLVIDVTTEYYDGAQALTTIVAPASQSRPRDLPRLSVSLLPVGAPQPQPLCETLQSCELCTSQPFCGWCGDRCVSGNRSAPSGTCSAVAYDFASCGGAAVPAVGADSCVVGASAGSFPLETPHTFVGANSRLLALAFDVRALRSRLLALSGGARWLAGGRLQLHLRQTGAALPQQLTASVVWMIPDVGSPRLCSVNGTATHTAVPSEAISVSLSASNTSVQISVPADALASALHADTLHLRLNFNKEVRVWSPNDKNDNERLSPVLVPVLTAPAQRDACDAWSRSRCLAEPRCGWCGTKCVSGLAFGPFDASACARSSYVFYEAPPSAGVAVQMRAVEFGTNPWPNMPSLDSAAVEVALTVPATLDARSIVNATLAFRFVRTTLVDGDVEYRGATVAVPNNTVVASVRPAVAARFSAPLAVRSGADGFAVDVTDALRAAADSATDRLVAVRIGNQLTAAVDVRVVLSGDAFNRRQAAALSVVTASDGADIAHAACIVHTSCTACLSVDACGWCVSDPALGTGSCVPGTARRALFGRTCAAWTWAACFASRDALALRVPLACPSLFSAFGDRATTDQLHSDLPSRSASLPRASMVAAALQVVTVDLAALRATPGGPIALLAPINLRLFAAADVKGADFFAFSVSAWSLTSPGALNVSVADCASLQVLAVPANVKSRTTVARELSAGDAIDIDVSAAFAGVAAGDQFLRIAVLADAPTPLLYVAPGNCLRARHRPVLLARSSSAQLTRSSRAAALRSGAR